MTAETLALFAGAVLSLLFSYFPGLEDKFKTKTPTQKRLIMAGLLVVVSAAIYGLSCAGLAGVLFGVVIPCTQEGALGLLVVLVTALISNQGTFLISPQLKK